MNICQTERGMHYLDDARIEALSPPKQEKATAMGIVQLNIPNILSANVWWKGKEKETWKYLQKRICKNIISELL